MSSSDHPDRDSLSAYLDESLSIDATQWIKHHLEGCTTCGAKLKQERAFLAELDGLRAVRPPDDFTQGVMARVAQYPTYQPTKELPWKRYAIRGSVAAAVLFVVALFIGWVVVAGSGEGLQVPAGAGLFTTAIGYTVGLWNATSDLMAQFGPQAEAVLGAIMAFVDFFRGAPLMVKLAILLVTVGLNYALTRMVLNYQQRH